jgi:hypothetical protein
VLYDNVGNNQEYSTSDLQALGFPTTLQVTSIQDTTPPVLTGFTFSPTAVNTTTNPATVSVTAQITDDLSGVREAYLGFNSPSGSQNVTVFLSLSSGTDLNGTWTGIGTFPVGSETGTWVVGVVVLYDNVGNNQEYSTSDLQALGFPTTLIVDYPTTTTTAVTSSSDPSVFGQTVTFTATVTPQGSGSPTGTVTFHDGSTTLGTSSLSSGTATFTISTLAIGTHSITAVYSGDSNFQGSSASLNQTVNQATASIAVASVSPAAEDYGLDAPITITALLSWTGSGAAPTANAVTIGGNGPNGYSTTTCGTPSGATMTCTATYTPTAADVPGSYTETATFAGDSNYLSSSSTQSNNFTINQATAGTVVTSSLNPSTFGQPVTFTATISGENGLVKGRKAAGRKGAKPLDVAGSVTWSDNTGCGTTSVSTGNPGIASCTTSSLQVGTNTITGTYSGDSNHTGSTGTLSGGQIVNQISQTITFTTAAPASATYNTSFTVAAAGGASGNPVTFTALGVCSITAGGTGTATYLMTSGTGTCSVVANQSGNSGYSTAPTVTETVSATLASQAITFTTPPPATAKSGDAFTVAATGGASGNAVVFTAGAGSVCTNSGTNGATFTMTSDTGYCYVVANQAGNSNYAAAGQVTESVTAVKTVKKVAATVTFTGTPESAAYLSSFTVATTANSGIIPKITAAPATVCTISGPTVTMKSGTGTCTLKASWATNDYYLAASLTQSTSAELLGTITTITNTIPQTKNPLKVEVYFAVTNGVNAVAGNVTVNASSGETCTGTVTAGKCLLTFLSTNAGPQTLTATYAGNTDDSASTSGPYPVTVN